MMRTLPPALVGNRYILHNPLGRGSMGEVYRATDRLTGNTIALKRVAPDAHVLLDSTPGNLSSTTYVRVAFANEFQLLASLRHPNIISVLEYGFDVDQAPYFTMAYLANATTILQAGEGKSLPEKIQLLNQLLLALAYLHRRGVIHRDLKPSNVLVADGMVRILDFGLSVPREKAVGQEGTLAYMPPEVIREQRATEQSDLYSVGIIGYQLLVGKHPFKLDQINDLLMGILYQEPTFEEVQLPLPIIMVLQKLLQKAPADRYQKAWEVIGALCGAADAPLPKENLAIRESFLQGARFVGRGEELDQLVKALENLHKGAGSAWLIGGESGVGKSRLLAEVRTRALVSGMLVLQGQGVAGGGMHYQVWREPVRRLVLTSQLDEAQASLLKEIVPDIGWLVGQDVPDTAFKEGAVWLPRFNAVLVEMIRQQPQPVVIFLEDLHWADESLEPLKYLCERLDNLPLLMVGSYRHDEKPGLREMLPYMQNLILERFSSREIAELSASMLGQDGGDQEILTLLENETEGNVYFLIETVRALAEEAGSLDQVAYKTLPQRIFAGGVQTILQRRLGRVEKADRALLNLAAIGGRQLDLKLLHTLAQGQDLETWLTLYVNAAVLEVRDGVYRFAHDRLRDQVVADLNADEKRALNQQLAAAIEQVYAGRLTDYVEMLTDYWQAAANPAKEAHYTLLAAKKSQLKGLNHQAQSYYRRLLNLHAYENAPDPQKALADLKYEIGRTCTSLSDFKEALHWQHEALTLYQRINDRLGIATVLGMIGEAELRLTLHAEAAQHVAESLAAHREFNNYAEIGSQLFNMGIIHANQGESAKALEYFLEARTVMEATGEPLLIGKALNNLGVIYDVLGDAVQSRMYLEESLRIRREIDDQLGIAYCLVNLQSHLMHAKEYALARQYAEESLVLIRRNGEKMALANAIASLGHILMETGELEAAKQHFDEAMGLRRQIQDRIGIGIGLHFLARLAQKQGNWQTAWQNLQESLTVALSANALGMMIGVFLTVGEILREQGQPDKALMVYSFIHHQLQQNPTEHPDPLAEIAALKTILSPAAAATMIQQGEAATFESLATEIIALTIG